LQRRLDIYSWEVRSHQEILIEEKPVKMNVLEGFKRTIWSCVLGVWRRNRLETEKLGDYCDSPDKRTSSSADGEGRPITERFRRQHRQDNS
jgi:hypothetical protein